MSHRFLPYSRYLLIDMETIIVLGGLDDTQQQKSDFFTNYVFSLSFVEFNKEDSMYFCQQRGAMRQGRGCFALTLNEGFLYVFGGVHGERERLSDVPQDKS